MYATTIEGNIGRGPRGGWFSIAYGVADIAIIIRERGGENWTFESSPNLLPGILQALNVRPKHQ
jgi:hypothetical protein